MLRRISKSPSTRTLALLGCSSAALRAHLLAKMCVWNSAHRKKITLANMQIDHIKPIRLARTASDVAALAHFSNLQPLLAADNREKAGRWCTADERFWRARISRRAFAGIYWPAACRAGGHSEY